MLEIWFRLGIGIRLGTGIGVRGIRIGFDWEIEFLVLLEIDPRINKGFRIHPAKQTLSSNIYKIKFIYKNLLI